LSNQRFKPTELDDEKFVFRWNDEHKGHGSVARMLSSLLTARLPKAALAALCTSVS
jgi:hypothetical protein